MCVAMSRPIRERLAEALRTDSDLDAFCLDTCCDVYDRFGLLGSDNADLFFGYRVLKQKYEDGDGRNRFDWDMTIHGPVAGLKFTF